MLLGCVLLAGCGLQNFDDFYPETGLEKTGGNGGGNETTTTDDSGGLGADDGAGGGGSGGDSTGSGGSGSGSSGSGGSGSGSTGEDCFDEDADGFDTCEGDCDDADPFTFPGAAEAEGTSACMRDADGDGWGDSSPGSGISPGNDCDDSDPTLNPADSDADGVSTCGGDCDDANAARSPGRSEVPFDGVDSDCDGDDGGFATSASGGGGTSYAISDYSSVVSTANVASCPVVYSVSVNVNIIHTYIGDLTVTVSSPGGSGVILHNQTGSATDNIIGTYASSGGSLTPYESLSRLSGVSGTGLWSLTVNDSLSGDTGYIQSWSIDLLCL